MLDTIVRVAFLLEVEVNGSNLPPSPEGEERPLCAGSWAAVARAGEKPGFLSCRALLPEAAS